MFNLKWLTPEERASKLNEIFNSQDIKSIEWLDIKAPNDIMHSGNVWGGAEFVAPATMTDYIINLARLQNPLRQKVRNISMQSNQVIVPIEWIDPIFNLSGESTDSANCNVCAPQLAWTARVTLTAKVFCATVQVTQIEMEDSGPDIMQYILDKLAYAYNDAIDNILINGDVQIGTTNINNNGGAINTNNAVLANDWIRKVAIANLKTVNAWVLDSLDIIKARDVLWVIGLNPSKLLVIPSPQVYYRMYALSQNSNGLTPALQGGFDWNGNLSALQGMPVLISSMYARAGAGKMLASGQISSTPANNTTGWLSIINVDRVIWASRKDLTISVFYDIKCDSYTITARFRGAWVALPEWVVSLVNVDVS